MEVPANLNEKIKSVNVNGKDYFIPKNLAIDSLGFFLSNSVGNSSPEADKFAVRAEIDAISKPESTLEKTLISALIGAQNRSNQLYNVALNADSLQFQELYFKYAVKYEGKVAQLAAAIAKIKNKEQKIVVEKINIEQGAQAIVGNISKQSA